MKNSQQLAIVTGGSRGIGKATAIAFARKGVNVVIADVLDEEGASLANEVANSTGIKIHAMATNKIKNVEAVSKMYEILSAKDIQAWISFWADDGIQYIPYSPEGFPKSVEGKKQLEEIYTSLLAGYGELKYTHIDIEAMDNPNKVLVQWGVDIELKGKTGRYQNELIGIFEFEDGKVKRFTEYFNPLPFLKAIN